MNNEILHYASPYYDPVKAHELPVPAFLPAASYT